MAVDVDAVIFTDEGLSLADQARLLYLANATSQRCNADWLEAMVDTCGRVNGKRVKFADLDSTLPRTGQLYQRALAYWTQVTALDLDGQAGN